MVCIFCSLDPFCLKVVYFVSFVNHLLSSLIQISANCLWFFFFYLIFFKKEINCTSGSFRVEIQVGKAALLLSLEATVSSHSLSTSEEHSFDVMWGLIFRIEGFILFYVCFCLLLLLLMCFLWISLLLQDISHHSFSHILRQIFGLRTFQFFLSLLFLLGSKPSSSISLLSLNNFFSL